MTTDPVTYAGLLRWGRDQLILAGAADAYADAKRLFQHVLGMDPSDVILKAEDQIAPGEYESFAAVIARRRDGVPVSRIIGTTGFMSLTFRTDDRALAPRQDSECLVELALERSRDQAEGVIVDLGTGSGCLVLSFLYNRPGWQGVAIDKSADALSLARENAQGLGLWERVSFIEGGWVSASDALGTAGLVISNPPYIPTKDLATLSREVREHDPALALDGGPDGLTAYRDILGLLSARVMPGVRVLMEIGFDQAEAVTDLCRGQGLAEIAIHNDFSGHNRVVEAVFPEKGLGGIKKKR